MAREDNRLTDYLEGELARARAAGDRHEEAVVLGDLGSVFLRAGQAGIAARHYQEALVAAEATGDKRLQAKLWGRRGVAWVRMGRRGKAVVGCFRQAMTLASEAGDERRKSYFLNCLIVAQFEALNPPWRRYWAAGLAFHVALKRPEMALEWFEAALKEARESGDREGEFAALLALASVYQRLVVSHLPQAMASGLDGEGASKGIELLLAECSAAEERLREGLCLLKGPGESASHC
jgi:tetratricopeptide (TPR) repeat protein